MYGKRGVAGGVKFQTVYSSHMSFLNEPFLKLTGVSLGFIIYTDTGRGIYAPGDTAIMTDIKLYAELYKPEIGLLGIGGFTGGEGTLTSYEAALIAKWMDLKVAIPHHYRESRFPKEFKSEMKKVSPGTRAVVLDEGGEIEL
jgi:L-ascorbate metabolism protein UlaG (beta-lactamase superfamily)